MTPSADAIRYTGAIDRVLLRIFAVVTTDCADCPMTYVYVAYVRFHSIYNNSLK